MNPFLYEQLLLTRRHFLAKPATASALPPSPRFSKRDAHLHRHLPGFPNFAPKAKRVIYLHQSGAPSQIDLFDYKPKLTATSGLNCPSPSAMDNASPA